MASAVIGAAFVGALCGVGSAGFLELLTLATTFRIDHEVIIYALPVAGVVIGLAYHHFGASIRGGTNLVVDTLGGLHEAHHTKAAPTILPARMAPMVLIGTVVTHLFGGSAGREGTAVQIGASLGDTVAHRIGASHALRRQLLVAGIAGGFGSVFGTPIAGMIFALEVVAPGTLDAGVLLPALVAAFVGDFTTRALGIVHTAYPQVASLALSPLIVAKWLVFAAAIAATATLFVKLTHGIKHLGERYITRLPLRLAIGGAIVVVMWKLIGTSDYLGLGVPTIVNAFHDPLTLPSYAFLAKLLFTAVTLGAGFIGGEVTPLFFIGATLGAVLASVLSLPIALGAGVGLAAVFAAAANTPVALSIMAVELVGIGALPHVVIVCVVAAVVSGRHTIYPAQHRTGVSGGQNSNPASNQS